MMVKRAEYMECDDASQNPAYENMKRVHGEILETVRKAGDAALCNDAGQS